MEFNQRVCFTRKLAFCAVLSRSLGTLLSVQLALHRRIDDIECRLDVLTAFGFWGSQKQKGRGYRNRLGRTCRVIRPQLDRLLFNQMWSIAPNGAAYERVAALIIPRECAN